MTEPMIVDRPRIEPMYVAMTMEAYERIPVDQRAEEWRYLIRSAGVTGAYIPIPFTDYSAMIVGMNIIRFDEPKFLGTTQK